MSQSRIAPNLTGTEPQTWETGLLNDVIFVGLDVHKARSRFALLKVFGVAKCSNFGTIPNRPDYIAKLTAKLGKASQLLLRGSLADPNEGRRSGQD
jgi:hypothetical protein